MGNLIAQRDAVSQLPVCVAHVELVAAGRCGRNPNQSVHRSLARVSITGAENNIVELLTLASERP